jgi:tRNA A37 methylthiotransferase MiaB
VAQSFVGREIKVLLEGEASASRLQAAKVSSWEHGLVREDDTGKIVNRQSSIANYLVARGEADAPDIDGRVYIRVPRGGMPIGNFARVRIIGHTDYDLMGEAVQ